MADSRETRFGSCAAEECEVDFKVNKCHHSKRTNLTESWMEYRTRQSKFHTAMETGNFRMQEIATTGGKCQVYVIAHVTCIDNTDGYICIWDLKDKTQIKSLKHDVPVHASIAPI